MPSWTGERKEDLSSVIAGFFGGLAAIYGPDDEEGSNEEKNYEVCAQEDQNASWRCWRVGIVILIGGGEDG
jgi:hypothetical protein